MNRKYSQEFKQGAVDQAGQPNVTLGQVAKELGLNPSMLGRWRFELSSHGRKAFKGQGNPRDEELSVLKRELARVKKERDFLREAATYFAKESK
jgi:transposase